MTSVTLYPYQQRWLKDRSRFKLGRFARQTGKTFTTTLEVVDDVLEATAAGKRSPWVILSRGERQAREAMEEGVFRHLESYMTSANALLNPKSVGKEEVEWYDADSGIKRKALQVVFTDRGKIVNKITALPANPDTARGFSANVFLDEFAFHQDSRKIWTALFPVISAGFKLRVTSTPNGKGNKFYDLSTAEDSAWSRHVVDIYQAVADGLPRDIEEMRAALNDEDAWAQEFELQWLDEASAWLSFELINSVEHDHAGIPEHYAGGPCFLGVDIAARNDLFVIWVLEAVGDVYWTREILARRRISFAEQDALLADAFNRYRVIRCCMDQTGMGEKPVEDAQRRFGTSRVEGVLFTGPNKLALATTGKEAFEDRRVRIPEGNQELRNDLHKLKKETSATGAPRFVADSDSAGHADRAWACFLALNAASSPVAPIDFQSIGGRRAVIDAGENELALTDRGFGTVSGLADFEGY
ncbi:terminase large subunit domain-containing protein [Methylococcus capsulatus]|uniref:phage terminase large subunit family protein n=1 Tax=Methylococcus capsulatus TaxID=414 RepID=UPI003CF84422